MRTSLDHLPPVRREQLQAITRIIARVLQPEKVILFGTFAATGDAGISYSGEGFPEFSASYELLVVTRRGDRRYDYEIQDIVSNRCISIAPVTVLVHDIDYVNARLSEGQYFFSMLSQEAILLYDAGHIPLVAAAPPDLALIRAVAKKDFDQWWLQAKAFFTSNLFNRKEREWKIAVFLLHQALRTLQAILLSFTGYKPCTHNLDKLRRYTNRFSVELVMLFPRDTPEEDRLFKLLLHEFTWMLVTRRNTVSRDMSLNCSSGVSASYCPLPPVYAGTGSSAWIKWRLYAVNDHDGMRGEDR